MTLPYNKWRRVSSTAVQGDTLLIPIVNRNADNIIFGIDTSSRTAYVVTSESTPEQAGFIFDTATGERYIRGSSGTLHLVTEIGATTLEWDSVPFATTPSGLVTIHNGALITTGDPPVGDTTYDISLSSRTARLRVGTTTVSQVYPDELLDSGFPVDTGPLGAVENLQTAVGEPVADDWEVWLFLQRSFAGASDSSMGIYRMGPSGLLGGGLVLPDTATLTGDANNEPPRTNPHNCFRYSASGSALTMKVKRIETNITQNIVVEGADGTLVELLPSTKTQGVLMANPSDTVLALDVIAFEYGGSTYTLESLTRVDYNNMLGQFTVIPTPTS